MGQVGRDHCFTRIDFPGWEADHSHRVLPFLRNLMRSGKETLAENSIQFLCVWTNKFELNRLLDLENLWGRAELI